MRNRTKQGHVIQSPMRQLIIKLPGNIKHTRQSNKSSIFCSMGFIFYCISIKSIKSDEYFIANEQFYYCSHRKQKKFHQILSNSI